MVTVPTSAEVNTSNQSNVQKNSKLIGGLVGSIGGTIVIGTLVLLFLFFKKRRSRGLTNQSPDFNDSDDDRKEMSELSGGPSSGGGGGGGLGFMKLLKGNKSDANANGGYLGALGGKFNDADDVGIHDLERQMNVSSSKYYGAAGTGGIGRNTSGAGSYSGASAPTPGRAESQGDEDFFYRGVTNNNNLDSVFRLLGPSTGRNATGTNTNTTASLGRNSRFNSYAMTLPDHFNFNEDPDLEPLQADYYDSDGELQGTESEFNPSDYDDDDGLLPGASGPMGRISQAERSVSSHQVPHAAPINVFSDDGYSNNLRLRFTEEIA